ncbi:MAG: LON peptidase substrate-binding domain-containing protein [Candidatus Xenobium sp.]|jgi:Lon protease-like protein|nr:hypothetical protein [Burkholderiales bacterium]
MSDYSEAVPIFPLAGLVFFPGTVLPLHLFEPRYREMALELLEGEGLLAVALLEEGWEEDVTGETPIFPIVTVGRARRWERQEDGSLNVELLGLARARILGEVTGKLWRRARLQPLEELPVDPEETRELSQSLLWGLQRLVGAEKSKPSEIKLDPSLHLGRFCDSLAFLLPMEPSRKMGLLAELDPAVRARALVAHLEELRNKGTLRRVVHILPGFSLN